MDADALVTRTEQLATELAEIAGDDAVIRDKTERELMSSDVYSRGVTAALVLRPRDRGTVPVCLGQITAAGFAVVPRGGGMSYTSGYTPVREDTVLIDMSGLNRIVEISADDMTITVEAGVTWQQIYEALQPLSLRLPFFGTFSGSRATVGGGMSNGALFMGTARYGTAAEIVVGMEVATATGKLIRTGQAAFKNGKAFYRTYGPDLTGLFVHDAGALGVKTLVSMRLIRPPEHEDYASFVFDSMPAAAGALTDVARTGVAEEAYIFDPVATASSLDAASLRQDFKRLLNVVRKRGLGEGARLVGAGRDFIDKDVFSLHVVCSADTEAEVQHGLAIVREIVDAAGGGEIANSMPKAARANPFEPLNGILGSKGERWAALNCKVAHSDAADVIARTDGILAQHADAMGKHGVWCSRLCIAISNHAFSFEPVLRWHDEWLPLHKTVPEPQHLRKFDEPAPNPAATELVDVIRGEITDLFAELGAASNQIGKTYRYFDSLHPNTADLLLALKRQLDPDGLVNPGALRLPVK